MNFYSYHTSQTRPRKIVLFGLPKMGADELKLQLAEINITPRDVKPLKLNSARTHGDNAAFLLYFEPNTIKLSDLRKVRHINNIIVRWESFQPKAYDQVPQCRTCQMFGHSSINCNMPPRCVLCAQSHKTEDCERRRQRAELQDIPAGQEVDRSFVKCANCNLQHTANYRGCASRKEFIDLQKTLNQRRRGGRRQQPESFVYRDAEFPGLSGIQRQDAPQPSLSAWGQPPGPLPTPDPWATMTTMMNTMNELISKLFQMMDVLTSRLGCTASPSKP